MAPDNNDVQNKNMTPIKLTNKKGSNNSLTTSRSSMNDLDNDWEI